MRHRSVAKRRRLLDHRFDRLREALLERASLFAWLVGQVLQPDGELGGMAVELTRVLPCGRRGAVVPARR